MTRPISRRTLLKGMGTAIALPWLEAMTPSRALAAAAGTPPVRTAFLFTANGVHGPRWFPKRTGFDFDLPSSLEPLRSFKNDMVVLSGLTHDKARANGDGGGDHARETAVFLTGGQPTKTDGAGINVGVSVDQVAAREIGHFTRFASLELGCEAGRDAGECDSGYSCAYSSNISWRSPTSPMGKEIDPRKVFDRLFASEEDRQNSEARARRMVFKKSILDFVGNDSARLSKQLGQTDRRKLDEYLTSIRDIERRLDGSSPAADVKKLGYTPPAGIPKEVPEHLRLMLDLIVLAFQTDTTRICSLMFGSGGCNRSYHFIGVPEGHHELSHHQNDPIKHDKIAKIDYFHVSQFAYFLRKMKSIPEGDSNLLDNSQIFYASAISDGDRHNHDELPVILAGKASGSIITGQHQRVAPETPVCNLYLSMLDRIGVSLPEFGDSTGRLVI